MRLLLSAKGRLLLMEGIQPQSWLDITFGLLDGWWRFDDDVRKDSPLIGAMQWKALFKDHNFSQSGYIKDSLGQTIFFAQASDVIGKTLPQLPFALIGEADYELNQTLQAQLVSLGETCIFYSDVHEIDSETQVQGIIYLRGCALPEFDSLSPEQLMQTEKMICEGLIDVAKALNKKQITTQRGLWVVTQGTQSIQTKINPIASTLWGMVRSLRHEMVDMRCVCLDLDLAQLPENNAAAIVESLYSAKNIEQIAKTAEGIYTHSLEKVFTAPRLVFTRI